MCVVNFKRDNRICAEDRYELRAFASEAGKDIKSLAMRLGIRVDQEQLPFDKSAVLIWSPRCGSRSGYRIAVNSAHSLERQRMSIAHEIAHYVLHRNDPEFCAVGENEEYGQVVALFEPRGNSYRGQYVNHIERLEREADRFAIELLMPPSLVRRSVHYRVGCTANLAREFKVSRHAMQLRVKEVQSWTKMRERALKLKDQQTSRAA